MEADGCIDTPSKVAFGVNALVDLTSIELLAQARSHCLPAVCSRARDCQKTPTCPTQVQPGDKDSSKHLPQGFRVAILFVSVSGGTVLCRVLGNTAGSTRKRYMENPRECAFYNG